MEIGLNEQLLTVVSGKLIVVLPESFGLSDSVIAVLLRDVILWKKFINLLSITWYMSGKDCRGEILLLGSCCSRFHGLFSLFLAVL